MKKIRWVFGILFVLAGIGGFTSAPIFSIACILLGISLIPKIWDLIPAKKVVRIGAPIVFLLIACITVPGVSGKPEETASNNSEDAKAVEVTLEPTVTEVPTLEPTETPTPELTETPTPQPTVTSEPVGDMTVHVLDVGQGLSIFVQSDGQNLIYDGGDRKTSSFVVSYLQQQGVEKLDYVINSHYDADHVYGLIGCINAFDIGTLITSDYEHDSETYEKFVDAANSKGIEMQHPAVGEEFDFGFGSFTILAPSSIDQGESNNNSVAIKLTNGSNSFIFTGDAESASESSMCSTGINLDCDVLVPSHHGSATGTSWEFLQATVPEYVVISCGENNQYGHPDKDTMDKFQSMGIDVYRTDKQGTVVVKSDGTTLSWNQEPCNDYTPGSLDDPGTQPIVTSTPEVEQPASDPVQEEQVWIPATGEKYHRIPDCGRMNPNTARQVSRSAAEASGYEACKKCY